MFCSKIVATSKGRQSGSLVARRERSYARVDTIIPRLNLVRFWGWFVQYRDARNRVRMRFRGHVEKVVSI
jgi:hypothetical protein